MNPKKKTVRIKGRLLCDLAKGKPALIYVGGKVHHTPRVVAIHEQTISCTRFETRNCNFFITLQPYSLAAAPISFNELAMCA